jgi:hypothetical protein
MLVFIDACWQLLFVGIYVRIVCVVYLQPETGCYHWLPICSSTLFPLITTPFLLHLCFLLSLAVHLFICSSSSFLSSPLHFSSTSAFCYHWLSICPSVHHPLSFHRHSTPPPLLLSVVISLIPAVNISACCCHHPVR